MKSIEQFLIEWLSKAGGFYYRGQFCLYSMKYALSSGNELWCSVVGKKAGWREEQREEGEMGGRGVGQVTIIDSFVAGFLCVGAGELSASCTRHDWTRQTGLTWKHIVCTWRVLPMWTTVPIIVCCLCTDNSAFSEAWQLKLHTRNTCGPAGKWLESRHQMISRWLWKPWYVVCSLRIGIYIVVYLTNNGYSTEVCCFSFVWSPCVWFCYM